MNEDVTISDLKDLNGLKGHLILKDALLQNQHDSILSMTPGKWYPVLNKKQLQRIKILIETGYMPEIEFSKKDTFYKLK